MLELNFPFIPNEIRSTPIVRVAMSVDGVVYKRYRCLFDSGANLPVACTDKALRLFNDFGKVTYYGKRELAGFGKDFEVCDVKSLSELRFSDVLSDVGARRNLCFRNLPFLLCHRQDMGVDFILSSSMFRFGRVFVMYCDSWLYRPISLFLRVVITRLTSTYMLSA